MCIFQLCNYLYNFFNAIKCINYYYYSDCEGQDWNHQVCFSTHLDILYSRTILLFKMIAIKLNFSKHIKNIPKSTIGLAHKGGGGN